MSLYAGLVLSSCGDEEPLGSRAQAAGNSDAVRCCKEVFPPGKERGQCIADAAKGQGPCGADAGVVEEEIDAAVEEVIDAAVVP
jgi:hypothetical protein